LVKSLLVKFFDWAVSRRTSEPTKHHGTLCGDGQDLGRGRLEGTKRPLIAQHSGTDLRDLQGKLDQSNSVATKLAH
jgi:hypothetical protein